MNQHPHRRQYFLIFTALGIFFGLFVGLGVFTFSYARGSSYLTADPRACVNCHVMDEYYDAWQTGSHKTAADCNQCHTPPDLIGKYSTKAVHGVRHSLAFTTGHFVEPIQIKPDSLAVVEANCRNCHSSIFQGTDHLAVSQDSGKCISCHRDVGHMR